MQISTIPPMLGLVATAAAVALMVTAAANAQPPASSASPDAAAAASADRDDIHPLSRIETHAPPGFRFYHPGYRLSGKGALVSVQICRLPGWAAATPLLLRVERRGATARIDENHERHLARLGTQIGHNCSAVTLPLDAAPGAGDTILVCAVSGRGSCSSG